MTRVVAGFVMLLFAGLASFDAIREFSKGRSGFGGGKGDRTTDPKRFWIYLALRIVYLLLMLLFSISLFRMKP